VFFNSTEGTVWNENKAMDLNVNIPYGRTVSLVQVELTAVKMCIYESKVPTVTFKFVETNSNDPNPLTSSNFLFDNCGCNICPENKVSLEMSAAEKQWRDSKQFTLDVHVQGDNFIFCIQQLTIKIHFAGECSHLFIAR
jgi:hypothetical protein